MRWMQRQGAAFDSLFHSYLLADIAKKYKIENWIVDSVVHSTDELTKIMYGFVLIGHCVLFLFWFELNCVKPMQMHCT